MKSMMLVLSMATAAFAQDDKREQVQAKLNNMRITLDFKDASLDGVIDYLREISDINMFVDTKVRDKNIVVTLKVSDISLKSVLGLMLKPHDCDVLFKDGVLQVMTKADVADKTMRMEIYDCRDILYPVRDFPGVVIDLS